MAQNRKIGKAKTPRNCSGRKSDRNPPARDGCSKMATSQNGDRQKWRLRKILFEKRRKIVKSEKKTLVNVAGGEYDRNPPDRGRILKKWKI